MTGEASVFDLSDTGKRAVEMSKVWWNTGPKKEGIDIKLTTSLDSGCKVAGKATELFEAVVNVIRDSV